LLSEIVADPDQVAPVLIAMSEQPQNRMQLESEQRGIKASLAGLNQRMANLAVAVAELDTSSAASAIPALAREMESTEDRIKALESELERVEEGLRVTYQTEFKVDRLAEVCRRLPSVLSEASTEEWQNLMREFGFRLILQKEPPHIMQVKLSGIVETEDEEAEIVYESS
jgi:predicted RNase H-like nuclease (RuvC/YqgF family)